MERPGVGLGVYIRKDGKILLGLRKSAHGFGKWCPPGGHLEMGETWEECSKRETFEETGLEIQNVRFVTATNDIFTESGKHYITLTMIADWKGGDASVMEPGKCEKWEWFEWENLPEPLMITVNNFKKTGYNPFTI